MNSQSLNKQNGSVMLEALIGILIFSVGILGLIGLQAASVKSASDAQYRTEAAIFADELIGQMWIADKALLTSEFAGPGNCKSGGAKYRTWCAKVIASTTGLPGAKAPTVTIAANNQVRITINWEPPGTTGGPHQYSAVTQVN